MRWARACSPGTRKTYSLSAYHICNLQAYISRFIVLYAASVAYARKLFGFQCKCTISSRRWLQSSRKPTWKRGCDTNGWIGVSCKRLICALRLSGFRLNQTCHVHCLVSKSENETNVCSCRLTCAHSRDSTSFLNVLNRTCCSFSEMRAPFRNAPNLAVLGHTHFFDRFVDRSLASCSHDFLHRQRFTCAL